MMGKVTVSDISAQGVVEVRLTNSGRLNAFSSHLWRALEVFTVGMESGRWHVAC